MASERREMIEETTVRQEDRKQMYTELITAFCAHQP